MNRGMMAMVALLLGAAMAWGERVELAPQAFDAGGWVLDVQFMDTMGSPYLLAHGMGRPVVDARARMRLPQGGRWRVWVRSRNWAEGNPGAFELKVDGRTLDRVFGVDQRDWAWENGGEVELAAGEHEVRLHDLSGFDGRCAGIILEKGPDNGPLPKVASAIGSEPDEIVRTELCVVGGGLPGCCAAVAAARSGVKTVLLQDRPVLGGNASKEVRVWSAGEGFAQPIVAELRGGFRNMESNAGISDDTRRRVVENESNIDLRLKTRAFGVVTNAAGGIVSVRALDWGRNRVVEVKADHFVDATGDGWVGFWAGAEWRMGRESRQEFGESYAPEVADGDTLGASLMWTSALATHDVPFSAPWAEKHACGIGALNGEWNWEYGIHRDMIAEGEEIRDRLLLAIYGAFSIAKRDSANSRNVLDFVPFILGKRESRRLVGDWVFNENDVTNNVPHADAIAKCSWSIDLHYDDFKAGVDFLTSCRQPHYGRSYVPFRSIYSRNVPNLMMAGRCFSCTHVGLGSPRVMNTLAQMGVAAGYAAAIMKRERCCPREVYARGLVGEIQRKMGGDWPGNPDLDGEGWQVVDDETPCVTFGAGWERVWNENGEQVGQFSHCAPAGMRGQDCGSAVYPLPVEAEGDCLIRMKTPFSPWPLEQTSGMTALQIHDEKTVVSIQVNQCVRQGQWRVIGRCRLHPGATLHVVPARSTSNRCIADGFAIKALSAPAIVDQVADVERYLDLNPHFAKAFEFLRRKDLAELPVGRYEIDGENCWAMIQEANLTPIEEETTVEAHRKYIDLQAPITGDETIGLCAYDTNRTDLVFDEKKDIVFFKAKVEPRTLHPGEFAIFFPRKDAHAPGHCIGENRTIRKLVIKVRAE